MSSDAAHTHWWETFEVIFGIPLLIGIALQFALPLSLRQGWLAPASIIAGIVLFGIGIAIVVMARRELARYQQPTDPGHSTSMIVTTGIFAYSRNPLYLGGVCGLVGVALVFDLPWVLVLLIPGLLLCHYVLIVPEERYLMRTFGTPYQHYLQSVHRWLGRRRHG